MSDALHPDFDRSGKYLYFTASTDDGLTTGWLDMSSINRPVTRAVYLIVLRKDLPSPFAPESDEEKVTDTPKPDTPNRTSRTLPNPMAQNRPTPTKPTDKTDKPDKDAGKVKIDFDNIDQRMLALPVPARNYIALTPGKEGTLFLLEVPAVQEGFGGGSGTLTKFDLTSRKPSHFGDNIGGFLISANGEKMLYKAGPSWAITRPPRRSARTRARSTCTRWRSTSIRRPSGSRCTTRSGASSATSSTTPACTASTCPRLARSTLPTSTASPAATT